MQTPSYDAGQPANLGPPADPEAVARAICLRQLTGAPRTRAQLANVLRRRKVPDEVADRVLSRFGDVGLIDDAEFARVWVQSRHVGRGLARRALEHELRARGVDDQVARDALATLGSDDEEAVARVLSCGGFPSPGGWTAPPGRVGLPGSWPARDTPAPWLFGWFGRCSPTPRLTARATPATTHSGLSA